MQTVAGFLPGRLERITEYLHEQVTEGRVAGISASVMRDGVLAYEGCAGLMDAARGKPMADDTIFRLYSMTKPIVSVAILMLYEQGKFQLDDPISKFLPEFSHMQVVSSGKYPDWTLVPAESQISFQHLLTHTSGLTYPFLPDAVGLHKLYTKLGVAFTDTLASVSDEAAPTRTLESEVTRLAQCPLLFQPGSQWQYGYSTDVLGRLVEIVSGQPLDEFCTQHILEPLKMKDTGFFVPAASQDRFAACYVHSTMAPPTSKFELKGGLATSAGFRLMDDGSSYLARPQILSGGGGMVGTSRDYLRFGQMLLNQGELDGARILGRRTVAYMLANHLPGDIASMGQPKFLNLNRRGEGFGLGLAVVVDPFKLGINSSVGECSWGGMASTFFIIDPVEKVLIVLMTQLVPSSSYNFRRQIRTLVYSAME